MRKASPADTPAVGDILSEFIDTTPWMPRLHTVDEDRDFCAGLIAEGVVTIAEDAERITGFIALRGDEIDALYVTRSARRQGIGSQLLNHAKTCRACLELWTFQANASAIRFYRRAGFEEVLRTGGQDNEERLPDMRMRWMRDAQGQEARS
ncbi:GNAT family N-acetyltransferase [Qingshengfaniella alkalisoli]|uniref:GNAT family N-acetyltransferase n=1 Tax=Qingshengfaniella alkalisoli TaxID=2599296 RepID=UPI001F10432E|nr:GNAT family N-acetyltransferase [Qingshengfaniella alkalisoli]